MTAPTLDDLFRYKPLGNVQLSLDGSAVLYTVTTSDLDENKNDSEIWLARTNGGSPIQLTRNPKADTRTGHGPNEPGLQYETTRRQKEWMDRWIRGKQPPIT